MVDGNVASVHERQKRKGGRHQKSAADATPQRFCIKIIILFVGIPSFFFFCFFNCHRDTREEREEKEKILLRKSWRERRGHISQMKRRVQIKFYLSGK
jgi:hypothetical protein